MGFLDKIGGGKKGSEPASGSQPESKPEPKKGRGRVCMYGHSVPRGKKMCEHRHWVG